MTQKEAIVKGIKTMNGVSVRTLLNDGHSWWTRITTEPSYDSERMFNPSSGGCHGGAAIAQMDSKFLGIVAPLRQSWEMMPQHAQIIDQYYKEVLPYFNDALLQEYKPGDLNIVVDGQKIGGNQAMMTLITSRQPWEREWMMPHYKMFRDVGFSPIQALFLMQFYKYNPTTESRAFGDHDPIPSNATRKNLELFISKGFSAMYHNKSSLANGNKEGVHSMFYNSRDSTTQLHRWTNNDSYVSTNPRIQVTGYLGRKLSIDKPGNVPAFLARAAKFLQVGEGI